jgi:hypothetical protein
VIHSAWRASDGSIGIVFLNISERPQQVAFRLQSAQYGFPPETDLAVAVLGLDRDENPVRKIYGPLSGGMGRIEHTMEARGMWALEFTLPQSKGHSQD